ncbi:MFS transporter [Arthrobacter sp. SD76]|uniref:MFS transporter n=1 Tax=Arthrobacter sp. SD76 TaxID=3415007 RepID=UPI003C735303
MDMFSELDSRPRLTRRQKVLTVIATWAVCLEFLDYFIVGFIIVFIGSSWNLSFGQSSLILLSSGIGAIVGAIYFGRLADRIGRRRVFITTIMTFTLATGALALTPDNAAFGWIYIVLMRVIVGFGAGGLYVVDIPMVQEFLPAAKRGRITGYVTSAVPLGFLVGSILVWLFADHIGWRGILMIAVGLGIVLLLLRLTIPESPRYLARNGDIEGARRSIAWALEIDPSTLPLETSGTAAPQQRPAQMRELFSYPRSLWVSTLTNLGAQTGYYGIALWTPTLFVLVLGIPAALSGLYMIFATLGALVGRFVLSHLAEILGRRATGAFAGITAAALLVMAALTEDLEVFGGVSVFLLVMIIVYFFAEGGFAIVGPYSAEVWPSALRTTGMGFAYGVGGIGKVIGPLGLGLIVGSSNFVKPDARTATLLPAFSYFAAWFLLCGLMFLLFGLETKGKSLETLDAEIEAQRKCALRPAELGMKDPSTVSPRQDEVTRR